MTVLERFLAVCERAAERAIGRLLHAMERAAEWSLGSGSGCTCSGWPHMIWCPRSRRYQPDMQGVKPPVPVLIIIDEVDTLAGGPDAMEALRRIAREGRSTIEFRADP